MDVLKATYSAGSYSVQCKQVFSGRDNPGVALRRRLMMECRPLSVRLFSATTGRQGAAKPSHLTVHSQGFSLFPAFPRGPHDCHPSAMK